MSSGFSFSPSSLAYTSSVAVQQKFRAWRQSTRPGTRRIPEDLWESAVVLAAMTTVHQVSSLLSLDFKHLKTRVIAKYGANCPALPRSYKKNAMLNEPVFSNAVETAFAEPKTSIASHFSGLMSAKKDSSSPIDGFFELSMEQPVQTSRKPPILAEIYSPMGGTLRLFSPDTAAIIQAFLRQ